MPLLKDGADDHGIGRSMIATDSQTDSFAAECLSFSAILVSTIMFMTLYRKDESAVLVILNGPALAALARSGGYGVIATFRHHRGAIRRDHTLPRFDRA